MYPFDDSLVAQSVLTDLDGVLCPDWPGGSEAEADTPLLYLSHLVESVPLFVPPHAVLGIVTSRLDRYRGVTEEWLARHGIRCFSLRMMPAETVAERQAIGSARWKAAVYDEYPDAILFVESKPEYATGIATLTKKPVLDWHNKQKIGG